jgi:hypothetical protein
VVSLLDTSLFFSFFWTSLIGFPFLDTFLWVPFWPPFLFSPFGASFDSRSVLSFNFGYNCMIAILLKVRTLEKLIK